MSGLQRQLTRYDAARSRSTLFRANADHVVVGFTATQIPKIAGRHYDVKLAGGASQMPSPALACWVPSSPLPLATAGELYPEGLDIWSETDVEKIIVEKRVDRSAPGLPGQLAARSGQRRGPQRRCPPPPHPPVGAY